MERGSAALFLDPGLGKTAIALAAFLALQQSGQASRMLVVAPLRVCQLVWRQEAKKWSQFRELRFALLHGPKKTERLKEDADVYLINPEGVQWLSQQFTGRDLPFDTVVIDELTKFKNNKAQRSKKLRKKIAGARRRWGLTGSPAPNGYMDLFGQMLMLDDGAALGQYITYYRDRYFQQGFNGFDWELRTGMAEKIEERISPYVLRMAAGDYLDLPPVRDNIIEVEIPKEARQQYEELKRDALLSLPEGVVTGANSGAVYSKLAQLANGAVYLSGKDGYVEVHDAKLAALEELVEELSGQPLLVGYEFQHDLERIRKRLGENTPSLSGLSESRIVELEAAWNRGEIPVLLAHPASMGHGLNLQGGGGSHVCWFSQPWDLELYEQFIRRILRQGSTASRITNHILRVRGTIDDLKSEALAGKDVTQQGLLSRLNAEILRDDPAPIAAGRAARSEEDSHMVQKLGFRNPSADAPQTAAPAAGAVAPKGWGAPVGVTEEAEDSLPPTGAGPSAFEDSTPATQPKGWGSAPPAAQPRTQQSDAPAPSAQPKGWGAPAGTQVDPQREEIRQKISAPPAAQGEEDEADDGDAANKALAAFGAGIVEQLTGDEGEDSPLPESRPAPAGWGAAPQPQETQQDAWEGVSTRYQNALQKAGYESPSAAWEAGKGAMQEVAGFGPKGWAELEALFGGEPEHAETTKATAEDQREAAVALGERAALGQEAADPSQGVRDRMQREFEAQQAKKAEIAAQREAQENAAALKDADPRLVQQSAPLTNHTAPWEEKYPNVHINISVGGAPREVLAAMFAALAKQYGAE